MCFSQALDIWGRMPWYVPVVVRRENMTLSLSLSRILVLEETFFAQDFFTSQEQMKEGKEGERNREWKKRVSVGSRE